MQKESAGGACCAEWAFSGLADVVLPADQDIAPKGHLSGNLAISNI